VPVFGFMKRNIMDINPWDDCNSLRYGFDESYDEPLFDDELDSEDEENE
jgi:hypothetical protein